MISEVDEIVQCFNTSFGDLVSYVANMAKTPAEHQAANIVKNRLYLINVNGDNTFLLKSTLPYICKIRSQIVSPTAEFFEYCKTLASKYENADNTEFNEFEPVIKALAQNCKNVNERECKLIHGKIKKLLECVLKYMILKNK